MGVSGPPFQGWIQRQVRNFKKVCFGLLLLAVLGFPLTWRLNEKLHIPVHFASPSDENHANLQNLNTFSSPLLTNIVHVLGKKSNMFDFAKEHFVRQAITQAISKSNTTNFVARHSAANKLEQVSSYEDSLKGPEFQNVTATENVSFRIVTGTSSDHFGEVLGTVATAQKMYPGVVIYVTDLIGDLSQEQIAMIKSWCYVKYQRLVTTKLDMEKQRAMMNQCAWKVVLIEQHLEEINHGEYLIWADASTRFTEFPTKWPREAFLRHVRDVGLVAHRWPEPAALYTHPDTFAELKRLYPHLISSGNIMNFTQCVKVEGGRIWMYKSDFLMNHLIKPWVQCAVTETCIVPSGATGFPGRGSCKPGLTGGCHRGDQSVLSILTYEVIGKHAEPTPANNWAFHQDDFPAITERWAYSGPPPTKCAF